MSSIDYIKKERMRIRRECEKLGITPLEWIEKYARSYYEEHKDRLNLSKAIEKKT